MSEIKEGDVRTYRGALVSLIWDPWRSRDYVEGVFKWEEPDGVSGWVHGELELMRIPKHVLREAWGRTCEVTVRFSDEEANVIDLKVIPTRKEQVARVLRLAAEMIPNANRDWYQVVCWAAMTSSAEVQGEAIEAFNSHLQRTGRIFGYGTRWNAFEGKSRPEDVDPDLLRAEQAQALLAAADEVEKGDD